MEEDQILVAEVEQVPFWLRANITPADLRKLQAVANAAENLVQSCFQNELGDAEKMDELQWAVHEWRGR